MDLNNLNMLLEMELPKLWDIMKLKCDDEQILNAIRYGGKCKFDIEDYVDGYYKEGIFETQKSKKVMSLVVINKQEYEVKEFYNEIKERRLAMIKWFELNLDLSTVGESRKEEDQNNGKR